MSTTISELLSSAHDLINRTEPYTTQPFNHHASPQISPSSSNLESPIFLQSALLPTSSLFYSNDSIIEWETVLTARYAMIRATLLQARKFLPLLSITPTTTQSSLMTLLTLYNELNIKNSNHIKFIRYLQLESLTRSLQLNSDYHTTLIRNDFFKKFIIDSILHNPTTTGLKMGSPTLSMDLMIPNTPSLNLPPFFHYQGLCQFFLLWSQLHHLGSVGFHQFSEPVCAPGSPYNPHKTTIDSALTRFFKPPTTIHSSLLHDLIQHTIPSMATRLSYDLAASLLSIHQQKGDRALWGNLGHIQNIIETHYSLSTQISRVTNGVTQTEVLSHEPKSNTLMSLFKNDDDQIISPINPSSSASSSLSHDNLTGQSHLHLLTTLENSYQKCQDYLIQPPIVSFECATPNESFCLFLAWSNPQPISLIGSRGNRDPWTQMVEIDEDNALPPPQAELSLDRMSLDSEIDTTSDRALINSLSPANLHMMYNTILLSQHSPEIDLDPHAIVATPTTSHPYVISNTLHQLGPYLPGYVEMFSAVKKLINHWLTSDSFLISKKFLSSFQQHLPLTLSPSPNSTPLAIITLEQGKGRSFTIDGFGLDELAKKQGDDWAQMINSLVKVKALNRTDKLLLFPHGFLSHDEKKKRLQYNAQVSPYHYSGSESIRFNNYISQGTISPTFPLPTGNLMGLMPSQTISVSPLYQSPHDLISSGLVTSLNSLDTTTQSTVLNSTTSQHPDMANRRSAIKNSLFPLIAKMPVTSLSITLQSSASINQLLPRGLALQDLDNPTVPLINSPQLILDPPVLVPAALYTQLLTSIISSGTPTVSTNFTTILDKANFGFNMIYGNQNANEVIAQEVGFHLTQQTSGPYNSNQHIHRSGITQHSPSSHPSFSRLTPIVDRNVQQFAPSITDPLGGSDEDGCVTHHQEYSKGTIPSCQYPQREGELPNISINMKKWTKFHGNVIENHHFENNFFKHPSSSIVNMYYNTDFYQSLVTPTLNHYISILNQDCEAKGDSSSPSNVRTDFSTLQTKTISTIQDDVSIIKVSAETALLRDATLNVSPGNQNLPFHTKLSSQLSFLTQLFLPYITQSTPNSPLILLHSLARPPKIIGHSNTSQNTPLAHLVSLLFPSSAITQAQFYQFTSQSQPILIKSLPLSTLNGIVNPISSSSTQFDPTKFLTLMHFLSTMLYSSQSIFHNTYGSPTPAVFHNYGSTQGGKRNWYEVAHLKASKAFLDTISTLRQRAIPGSTSSPDHTQGTPKPHNHQGLGEHNSLVEIKKFKDPKTRLNKKKSTHDFFNAPGTTQIPHFNTLHTLPDVNNGVGINSTNDTAQQLTLLPPLNNGNFLPITRHFSTINLFQSILYSFSTDLTTSHYCSIPSTSKLLSKSISSQISNPTFSSLISVTMFPEFYPTTTAQNNSSDTTILIQPPTHLDLLDRSHAYIFEAILSGIILNQSDNDHQMTPHFFNGSPSKFTFDHYSLQTMSVTLGALLNEITQEINEMNKSNDHKLPESLITLITALHPSSQSHTLTEYPFGSPVFVGLFSVTLFQTNNGLCTLENPSASPNFCEKIPTRTLQLLLKCLPIVYLFSRSLPITSLWLNAALNGLS